MKDILKKYPNLAQNVVENTADAILITDNKSKIVYVNSSFSKMTGYSPSELIDQKASILSSDLHEKEFYENLFFSVLKTGHYQGEIRVKRKNLEQYTSLVSISKIGNEYGNVTNYVVIARDITKQKNQEKEIHSLAFYDALTALPNRRLFENHLHDSLSRAKRHEEKIAIIFMDMDNFKVINDSYGHKVGDKFLQEVTSRIKDAIREEDTLSRIGGDEFVLLLEEVNGIEDAAHAAERIIEQVRKPFNIEKNEFYSAVSLGISIYPDDSEHYDTLLEYADKAMYHVKNSGKNNFEFYNSSMNQKAVERLQLEHELSFAQKRNELELHYQSKTNLETMQVTCMEALVRWRRPNHGLMAPSGFIPIAKQSDIIISIGSWVLHEACSQTKRLNDDGHNLSVSVNISTRQISDDNFVNLISGVLKQYNLDGKYLELEITESALLKDADLIMKKIDKVRAMGVKFSIDDFGIGYSSMNTLKELKIDKIKIDEKFIKDITTNSNDKAITAAIIALAHNLNIEVVAEGVETTDQVNTLKELGCNIVQGYLFSVPATIKNFEGSLKKQK